MSKTIADVRAHLAKLPPTDNMTIAERRAQYERAEKAFPTPPDVKVEHVTTPGPAEWLTPPGARTDAAVLYLHGGGYVIGSPRSHRHLAAAIGRAAKTQVLLPDYRLAPEHPYPTAVEDAYAAYRWLLMRGIAPSRIAVAGDSAGGGLTAALLVAIRDRGMPLPAAGVCISPWTDLTCSAKSYETRKAADPIVKSEGIEAMAKAYLAGKDPKAPLVSPLFADLKGLPPLLIHVGNDEVLLDDAVQLGERARANGVDTTLEVWDQMVHVWHWFFPILDEGQQAIDRIGAFVTARIQ
jgi:acetyl esterase/lipase